MDNNLSPKPVKPAAVWRWMKQALDLVGRGFIAWFALMAVFCVVIYLCRASEILSQYVAAVAYLAGIAVAAGLDDTRQKSLSEILATARSAVGGAMRFAFALLMPLFVLSVFIFLIQGQPEIWVRSLYDPAHIEQINNDDFLMAANQMFIRPLLSLIFFLVIYQTPMFSAPFQYHLQAFFGFRWFMSRKMGRGGVPRMNVGAMVLFNAISYVIIFVVLAFAPIAAPVVYAFMSAMSYVAFREIYLGIGQNRKVAIAEIRAAVAPAA